MLLLLPVLGVSNRKIVSNRKKYGWMNICILEILIFSNIVQKNNFKVIETGRMIPRKLLLCKFLDDRLNCCKLPKVRLDECFCHWNIDIYQFCTKNWLWVITVSESARSTPSIFFVCSLWLLIFWIFWISSGKYWTGGNMVFYLMWFKIF